MREDHEKEVENPTKIIDTKKKCERQNETDKFYRRHLRKEPET